MVNGLTNQNQNLTLSISCRFALGVVAPKCSGIVTVTDRLKELKTTRCVGCQKSISLHNYNVLCLQRHHGPMVPSLVGGAPLRGGATFLRTAVRTCGVYSLPLSSRAASAMHQGLADSRLPTQRRLSRHWNDGSCQQNNT